MYAIRSYYDPEYRLLKPGDSAAAEDHLTPIYPATEGVHQLTLRALTEQALQYLDAPAGAPQLVITSYSIHYTKLYEGIGAFA